MNVTLILLILLLLLLTGTPISIALGMTVLTFLVLFSSFALDTVDIVSQRLFTGLESFAIMAVPFFVLSGTLLTEGGIARAHHPLRARAGGLDARRAGDGGNPRLRILRHHLRFESGDRGGDRFDHAAGDGQARLSETIRGGRDRHVGLARHPDSAFDRDDHLRGQHLGVRRQTVHGRRRAGHPAGRRC